MPITIKLNIIEKRRKNMGKTNKELAIDIAIEYAHGMLHVCGSKGYPVEECCEVIRKVYETLEEISPDEKE